MSEIPAGLQDAPPSRIWIVEDDGDMIEVYQRILAPRYQVSVFTDPEDLFRPDRFSGAGDPDLMLFDLQFTGRSMLDVLGQHPLPSELKDVPFIFVSGVKDAGSLRSCFDQGAVDFMTKPFSETELLVKIERALKPGAELQLDLSGFRLRRHGSRSETLTSREMQILHLLMKHSSEGIPRENIRKTVWGQTRVVESAFDVHLFNLRRKIKALGVGIRYRDSRYFLALSPAGAPAPAT